MQFIGAKNTISIFPDVYGHETHVSEQSQAHSIHISALKNAQHQEKGKYYVNHAKVLMVI